MIRTLLPSAHHVPLRHRWLRGQPHPTAQYCRISRFVNILLAALPPLSTTIVLAGIAASYIRTFGTHTRTPIPSFLGTVQVISRKIAIEYISTLYVAVERLRSHDLRVAKRSRPFQAFHRCYNRSALLITPQSGPLRFMDSL